MKKLKFIIAIIALLLQTTIMQAQYSFRSIDIQSGLSDNYVRSILKDQQGFLWFGTLNGLTRFDGFRNRIYPLTQNDGKQKSNIIQVAQDKSAQIWVTTYDGHIFCYNQDEDCMMDNASERLAQLGIKAASHNSNGKNAGGKVIIDQDKNLWYVSNYNLYYYIYDENHLYQMKLAEPVNSVTCREGIAYAQTGKGHIYRINVKQKNAFLLATYPMQAKAKNLRIYQDNQGNVWTYDQYVNGLYLLPLGKTSEKARREKGASQTTLEKICDENVSALAEDRQGNLWIGTNSAGIIIRQTDGTSTRITRNEDNPYPLTSNHIYTILIDNENMAWIGSTKVGVAYTNLNNYSITSVATPFNEDIGFLCQDAMGKLWIGYDGNGLYCETTGKLYQAGNSMLKNNLVIGGRIAGDRNIYLGTYGGGIYQLTTDAQIRPIWQEYAQLKYARRVIEDKKGNFWIGGVMSGLCCVTPQGKFRNYTYQNSILRTNAITDLAYTEQEDVMLIATSTGLYQLNARRELKDVAAKELQNACINAVYADRRRLRWVCTNDEVRIYDAHFRLLKAFGKNEELNNALAITGDHQGQMWITTSKALFNIRTGKNEKGNYTFHVRKLVDKDGLGNITFCKKAIYCASNGDILAGGCGKYIRLSPSLIEESMKARNVVVTELQINGKVIALTSDKLQDMEFEHDEEISLFVSTLDYTHAAPLRFAYRLDNDEEWKIADGNCIQLGQPSWRKHILQVKGLDGNDDKITTITFRVLPPFWLSGKAIMLYFLLLVLISWQVWKREKRRKEAYTSLSYPESSGAQEKEEGASAEKEDFTIKQEEALRKQEEAWIAKATALIEQHLSDSEFSVENFSEEMNMSRSALYKKLMAATGKSPLEFMRSIRLKHGLAYLQTGDLSISEIAYNIGLSPKQFAKFFKEEYGCLPSQYKKK